MYCKPPNCERGESEVHRKAHRIELKLYPCRLRGLQIGNLQQSVPDAHVGLVREVNGKRCSRDFLVGQILHDYIRNERALTGIVANLSKFFKGQLQGWMVRRPQHYDTVRCITLTS